MIVYMDANFALTVNRTANYTGRGTVTRHIPYSCSLCKVREYHRFSVPFIQTVEGVATRSVPCEFSLYTTSRLGIEQLVCD